MMGRIVPGLFISVFIILISGSASENVILDGTGFFLASGDSYGLSQGYVIKLKSVSNEGSVWVELELKDKLIKSEIVRLKSNFSYDKTNRTIISMKVDKIYSGSKDMKLVSFYPVYQYIDPDLPNPKIIETTSAGTIDKDENIFAPEKKNITEPVIWISVFALIIILFYVLRKIW